MQTYSSFSDVKWMSKMYIFQQEQDTVYWVILFSNTIFPCTKNSKTETKSDLQIRVRKIKFHFLFLIKTDVVSTQKNLL